MFGLNGWNGPSLLEYEPDFLGDYLPVNPDNISAPSTPEPRVVALSLSDVRSTSESPRRVENIAVGDAGTVFAASPQAVQELQRQGILDKTRIDPALFYAAGGAAVLLLLAIKMKR